MCSECGMNLVPAKQKVAKESSHDEHNKHAGHSTNIFKAKFWVSFILSIPIVAYSDIAQNLLHYQALAFPGSAYLSFAFASIIFFYGGWVFITSAYRELKARLPGMMTLIALAISVAYFYSVAVTFLGQADTLFWELATLITIMLLGHWLEMRAVSGAQSALKELSKLLPDEAEVIRGGKSEIIPLSELKKDDVVLVRPGGRIPADGIVKEGISDVNESVATGESKPVPKKEGGAVIAGTTNGDGSLKITVAKIGDETFLAGVMRLVAEAQSSKSRLQMLSDRAAYYLTIIAVVTGGITFATWLAFADPAFAIKRMVAVLVIACPHALGLAIPLIASISTTKAARNGFLIKQRLALEAARNINVVLFDKTGTLTRGEFGIDKIIPETEGNELEVLQYAASANSHSEHPLAKAMILEAKKKGIEIPEAKNFQRIPGKGVRAEISGAEVFVGSLSLAEDRGLVFSSRIKTETGTLAGQGKNINVVINGGKILGIIALTDVIREESREAIKTLRDMGVKTAMITGDTEDVAKWVAQELGIDEYFAKVLPGEKSEKVKFLQLKGQKVAMVGDGVNDAPALTQADLGIAIGAGTNVAIESAGIILVRNDPRDIAKIIRLSKLTYTKMIQNLFWATGYNIVAIPLAAGALAFKGIFLEPAFAAVLMSLSTVIVAFNAMLLRHKTL
ncbi:copper-translocating P-type ATPase [Candidatus Giovannonibacteria bacterium RIFCSPLOWO2_12_FULL_43_11c]|uniref:Copper-translocating P-type ATPase n=1 Tax=Candidatus Giovannonibacteria bacterium RIFCSPHIGHO2_12_FULL_43_15 TaxID=1798341 RepID=A0A1F5WP20_9BACT|nr:MAG: copper-translocating P-type ATPase [Candidatus Giovannonibacteria bacterium RIFCSPHIGHO2_01_FULL_43_100]OGF67353.1 MAG: copper-translocating P-type ATPase [Candidatus Giovannonibacteria bacterium RIFCSPHIGHO2_02_FULL_43_32]OGF77354.1 MAG: copper-translocating P-type ATPase [Candidatus Giovannonibacteria bacterium RIFCSPHIGHO2_12_FULL_43_15]OGF78955.1 MAG: copper-translocating P-type ATPase [Candidatus Giovannonibacteria bacterium RIFCSPLOWO2_01_FULL_43_60]OGF92556.1 MAG: copper-transloc